MELLLSLSFTLLVGLMMSRLAKPLGLPAVTAYLVAGLLIGPFALGLLDIPGIGFHDVEDIEALSAVSKVALGFIAFEIGNEFRISQLKKTGKQAAVIGVIQALVAALIVDIVLVCIHFVMPDKFTLSSAICLGAIATATAPASTIMVVKQYKAKGELTDLLLPIVALDDAVGIVVFSVSFGIAKALEVGTLDVVSVVAKPLFEIGVSLIIGGILGFILTKFELLFYSRSKRTGLVVAFVILGVAISMLKFPIAGVEFELSSLLLLMMMGTVFCNTCELSENLMEMSDRWAGPILILFFVLSGAELDFKVFTQPLILLIGGAYIVARTLGKYFGAYGSAKLMKCKSNICNYLGVTLFPQAGVALGMAMTVKENFTENAAAASVVVQVVVMSVLIYELVGPLCSRIALEKAGDIKPKDPNLQRGASVERRYTQK